MASYIVIFSQLGDSESHAVFQIAVECLPNSFQLSEGCYLFTSDDSPQVTYQDLVGKLPEGDRLHVLKVSRPAYGHGEGKVNKWLSTFLT